MSAVIDTPDLVLESVLKVMDAMDPDRRRGVELTARVLRDVIRTANKGTGSVGDIALMLVSAERARGPLE